MGDRGLRTLGVIALVLAGCVATRAAAQAPSSDQQFAASLSDGFRAATATVPPVPRVGSAKEIANPAGPVLSGAPVRISLIVESEPLRDYPALTVGLIGTTCRLGSVSRKVNSVCLMDSGGMGSFLANGPVPFYHASMPKSEKIKTAGGREVGVEGGFVLHVELGSARLPSLNFLRIQDPSIGLGSFQGLQAEATIGGDGFRDVPQLWEFFGSEGSLTLNGKPPCSPSEPMEMDRYGRFFFRVGVGSEKVQAMFDTGSSLSVVEAAYAGGRPVWFKRVGDVSAVDATGQKMQPQPLYQAAAVRIGSAEVAPAHLLGMDMSKTSVNARSSPWKLSLGNLGLGAGGADRTGTDQGRQISPSLQAGYSFGGDQAPETPALILGYNVISQFRWYFDPGRKLWCAEKVR